MKVGFIVRTGPYTSQNIDTMYKLVKALLKKGHEAEVFLYEDGVINMDADIKSFEERNIKDRIIELINEGVKVTACGTCAKFRGQTKKDIIEDAKHGGMAILVSILKSSDKFLSLGF